MTVKEFMSRYNASPHLTPAPCGGDFILALSSSDSESPENYLAVTGGAYDVKAEILSEIAKRNYVLSGGSRRRKTAVRKFTLLMYKQDNDPISELLASPDILFGIEQQCVFNYVYFNAANGKGEKGKLSVVVACDGDGSLDEPVLMTADMYGCEGVPEYYCYEGVL